MALQSLSTLSGTLELSCLVGTQHTYTDSTHWKTYLSILNSHFNTTATRERERGRATRRRHFARTQMSARAYSTRNRKWNAADCREFTICLHTRPSFEWLSQSICAYSFRSCLLFFFSLKFFDGVYSCKTNSTNVIRTQTKWSVWLVFQYLKMTAIEIKTIKIKWLRFLANNARRQMAAKLTTDKQ